MRRGTEQLLTWQDPETGGFYATRSDRSGDAEQELFESRVNLVRAERDEVVASYRLKSAVGELTVVHLGFPVPIYDPTGHRDEVRGKWFGLDGD